ncbi:hypothetical protein FB107DRAFT_279625 [Schizophyllum commune]
MSRPRVHPSANRHASKASNGRARNPADKTVPSTVSQRPQRQAARRVLSERAAQGNKVPATSKRPASPNAETPSTKRPKRNATRDENTNHVRRSRNQSKGKGPRHAHIDDDLPASGNEDDDDEVLEDDEDDGAFRPLSEDEQDFVEDDDADDEDPSTTVARMFGSDDEDQHDAGADKKSPESRMMSARERARRDEEPILSDSEHDEHQSAAPMSPGAASEHNATPSANTSGPSAHTPSPAAVATPFPSSAQAYTLSHAPGWAAETFLAEKYHGERNLSLRAQQAPVQAVAKAAIDLAIQKMLFENAFPEENTISLLNRQTLVEAAEACNTPSIRARLLGDPTYSVRFDAMINNRVTLMRSKFKQAADDAVPGFYDLPNDETRKEVAAKHLDLGSYHYARKEDGTYIDFKPFSNRCVISVIQSVVFRGSGRRAIARKLLDAFLGISQDEAQLELPIPMVAVAATAVGAALKDHQLGLTEPSDFAHNKASGIYKDHAHHLASIRTNRPPAYHRLMMDLFKAASGATLCTSDSEGISIERCKRSLPVSIEHETSGAKRCAWSSMPCTSTWVNTKARSRFLQASRSAQGNADQLSPCPRVRCPMRDRH